MDEVLWRAREWNLHNEDAFIHFLKFYNHRTRPIEGDLIEVVVKHGMTKALEFLLDEGEVLKQKHMEVAIVAGAPYTFRKVKMVKHLVKLGLKVDGTVAGASYLVHEVGNGQITMVRTLLKLGANVNATDAKGFTPLVNCKFAPQKKLISMVKILLQHGADERLGDNILSICSNVEQGSNVNVEQAERLAKSVANWRQNKIFSLVSKAFLDVSKMKLKNKKSKKKFKRTQEYTLGLGFFELNPDILSEVLLFL